MEDLRVFFDSLHYLKKAYGDEVVDIVNFDYVLKQKEVLEWLQSRVEGNIAMNFLPGFQFKDLNRFTWHLRKEEYFRSFLLGHQMPPSKFNDTWIRRFLAPTRFHYVAEVARALQKQAKSYREHRKLRPELPEKKGWIALMRDWIAIEDTMRGYTRRGPEGIPWSDKYSDINDETLFKWARKTQKYRKSRRESLPRNFWQISRINYNGEDLQNVDEIFNHVGMIDTGYSEHWKWVGDESIPSPRRTSLSFLLPASLDTWDAPDRKG